MIAWLVAGSIDKHQDYRVSELTITGANKEHSGNYSCVPSRAQPAFVVVHVFKGMFRFI